MKATYSLLNYNITAVELFLLVSKILIIKDKDLMHGVPLLYPYI